MINCNSNCSRVDSVKALANQLKMQAVTTDKIDDRADSSKRLKGNLQDLDTQIKSGDAKKAETALAAVKREISASASEPKSENGSGQLPGRGEPFRGFAAYA